ncbi:hypothetical protein ABMA27_008242 [Loxostege sticticalis]|uniref:Peptidase M14 domain-containing protein n=1 Tax=Loxostege sticticalis TaxID=481309 RepID=A0ABR3HAM4_LOXSC
MCRFSLGLVLVLFSAVSGEQQHDYKGYSVHGVKLQNRADQRFIQTLESKGVDVWNYGHPLDRDALIMLSPEIRTEVLDELDERDLTHYLHLANVEEALKKHEEEINEWKSTNSRNSRLFPFQDYSRYAEIDAYLERVAAEHPDIVTLVNAGKSFEGRDIKYVKISTTNFKDSSKPIYFMDAAMHAREWVTPPVALYSIHRLVENLRDQDKDLLENIDWIILPLANPDGYEFSHENVTENRMWRGTRSFNPEVSATCYGADINRNFEPFWGTIGVVHDPCSLLYPGSEAFSEPETRIIRDIMLEHLDRIQIYMDMHSYGNWVTFGFGNETLPDNAVHLQFVGSAMGASMDPLKLPEADLYKVGNSALTMYVTSGCGQDFGQTIGIPFSFTLELPGYGFGFLVPPRFIEHMNSESWEGIATSARLSRTYYSARMRSES